MILIFIKFDIFNALDQLSGFGSVEDLNFSDISANVAVAIFRVKESEATFAETSGNLRRCTQPNAEFLFRTTEQSWFESWQERDMCTCTPPYAFLTYIGSGVASFAGPRGE